MKQTIPLKTLLEQIVPLPWPNNKINLGGIDTTTKDQMRASIVYGNHCANTLPKLVEAIRKMGYYNTKCGAEFIQVETTELAALYEALAAAEQVEI